MCQMASSILLSSSRMILMPTFETKSFGSAATTREKTSDLIGRLSFKGAFHVPDGIIHFTLFITDDTHAYIRDKIVRLGGKHPRENIRSDWKAEFQRRVPCARWHHPFYSLHHG